MSNDSTEVGKLIQKCISQSNVLEQIVHKQIEYINLLGEECNEYAHYMSARNPGWESSRYDAGEKLRNDITDLKNLLIGIKNGSNIDIV